MNILTIILVVSSVLILGCTNSYHFNTSKLNPDTPVLTTSNSQFPDLDMKGEGTPHVPFNHNYDISQFQPTITATTQTPESTKSDAILRYEALRNAAITHGAQQGLLHTSLSINQELKSSATELTTIFNFQQLMIDGPDGVKVRPPVISEAQESWESYETGKVLRVADLVYEIISQAQFTSVAPTWQEYLITAFSKPELPSSVLRPNNDDEQIEWDKWHQVGWNRGKEQANKIFESNLYRLNRDYQGMVRYMILLEEGKISPALIAQGILGNTGDGQSMRVNDRTIRITKEPELVSDSTKWSPSPIFTEQDDESIKNPESK